MTSAAIKAMSEADLQECVIATAHLFGWRVAHFRAARTAHGWATPVAADGKGYPDLSMARDRLLFVECKAQRGRATPEQLDWLATLSNAGAECYVWRPEDWASGAIEDVLKRRS